jgi:uracil-DNA glycosylase
MDKNLFSSFAPLLRTITETELRAEIARPKRLLIDADEVRGKKLEIAYAPFDYINVAAQIVIVGLTPGRQQMENALLAAWHSLKQGQGEAEAMREAKVFASFSGPMRANLVAMLDSIGLNQVLGIATTGSLWEADAHRVHFTSILRYPVFVDGANYNGVPAPLPTALLREQLMKWFATELAVLPNAVFVPLGPVADEAVNAVVQQAKFDRRRVLSGLPHPSGANAERIAFFLGRKHREDLSTKVDPEKLIAARAGLFGKISALVSFSG